MTAHRDQVAVAVQAVTVLGEARYAWLGRASRSLPRSLLADLSRAERRTYLVTCLREELYSSFYCHGRPVPARWDETEFVAADPSLSSALSKANCGSGTWDTGWTVERVEGSDAILATGSFRTRVPISRCRVVDAPLRAGGGVSVRLPNELPALSPGFYTVVADTAPDRAASPGIVRVYWNISSRGAPQLVRALTSSLNAEHVPFRLKVADNPQRFDRCDAAVLYLHPEAFPALRGLLRDIAVCFRARLRPETPAFTLELVPGVGLAEADGTDESFGVRRCALVAEGIVRAHEQAGDGVESVIARFAEAGVLVDAPYLEPSLAGRHVL
jgi:hypothetical protein